jgi:hypothetical protein
MASFDITTDGQVGIIDFSKYVNLKALLSAGNWPRNLVPLATIAEALEQGKLIAGGYVPDGELDTAPTLTNWHFVDHTKRGQGLRLTGICRDHPILLGKRRITTSHIVAIDLDHFKWARTLSRYYKLSRFSPSGD